MKFFIEDFFSKCDQIPSFLRIWSHLLKESLMENFIFSAVITFEVFFLGSGNGHFPKLQHSYVLENVNVGTRFQMS